MKNKLELGGLRSETLKRQVQGISMLGMREDEVMKSKLWLEPYGWSDGKGKSPERVIVYGVKGLAPERGEALIVNPDAPTEGWLIYRRLGGEVQTRLTYYRTAEEALAVIQQEED